MDRDDILTVEQAAELLDVSIDTMRKSLRLGQVPGAKVGREWRLSRRALAAYLRGEWKPTRETDTTEE